MSRDQVLLEALGERLRQAREARGLTVAALARAAGLSRRYVTEAEAGRANPSLLKLAALARVLRRSLPELCDLPLGGRPRERIALVGLRGAGKSTVGRRLALALEVPFCELDARIEELAGMSLRELFALQGEETYRRLEREALELVLKSGERMVIETGGSIVESETTYDRLRGSCHTIWLRASPEEHLARVLAQGDRRPFEGRPRALEELRELLAQRGAEYSRSDRIVDTDGRDPSEVVDEILRCLQAEEG